MRFQSLSRWCGDPAFQGIWFRNVQGLCRISLRREPTQLVPHVCIVQAVGEHYLKLEVGELSPQYSRILLFKE